MITNADLGGTTIEIMIIVVESPLRQHRQKICGQHSTSVEHIETLTCMTRRATKALTIRRATSTPTLTRTGWMEAGAEASHTRQFSNRQEQPRTYAPPVSRLNWSFNRCKRPDGTKRPDSSRECLTYGPRGSCGATGHDAHICRRRCKFCKKVHEVGRCELFARSEKLTKFIKTRWTSR